MNDTVTINFNELNGKQIFIGNQRNVLAERYIAEGILLLSDLSGSKHILFGNEFRKRVRHIVGGLGQLNKIAGLSVSGKVTKIEDLDDIIKFFEFLMTNANGSTEVIELG